MAKSAKGETLGVWQMIKQRATDMYPLYQTMDEMLDIYSLKPFVMRQYDGTVASRVDNVTLPKPRIYVDRVVNIVNSCDMVIRIKGISDDRDVQKLKNFYEEGLQQADIILRRKGLGKLRNNLAHIGAVRGFIAVRVFLWENEGEMMFDTLYIDPRFAQWVNGENGTIWFAHTVKKHRSVLEKEYNYEASSTYVPITEYWDDKQRILFAGDKGDVIKADSNPLGYCPVLVRPIGMIQRLASSLDTSDFENVNYSLLAPVRDLMGAWNKLATIGMTTAAFSFRAPLQKVTPVSGEPSEIDTETQRKIQEGGAMVVDMGHDRLEPIPYRDISAVFPFMWEHYSKMWQQATLPDVEFGEAPYGMSAVAIAKLTEGRLYTIQPLVETLQDVYEFILGEYRAQYPQKKLLARDHDVKVEFHIVSPEENIARYSIAAAARGFMDLDTIRTEILRIKNEAEVQRKLDMEFAEAIMPELRLYRIASQIEKTMGKDDEDAKIMLQMIARKIGMSLSSQQEQKPPPQAEPEPIVPLMGTQEGSAKQAQELEIEEGRKGL